MVIATMTMPFAPFVLQKGARAAASTPAPVLTVLWPGSAEERRFSRADLEAFPQASISTHTPWHAGVERFSGVPLDSFLETLGGNIRRLRLIALNDYVVETDIADVENLGAVLAIRENGTLMPLTDKGPVFLMFPFDNDPRLQHQSYYSRAVWQLCRIELL
ncbi:oxidoreductase [Jiella sp. M17.18]|uniref:oxidoreductase n=1 Tax=Jiella sp. M17.18 TaxID=3234247 RepID=UPI0034DF78D3